MLKRIAILGSSNSGKTTFINKLISDVNSFAPKITISEDSDKSLEYSANEVFIERKLSIVPSSEIKWDISILDYSGRIITDNFTSSEHYRKLTESFNQSELWFVMIDGALFECKNINKIIELIKTNVGNLISTFFKEYYRKNNKSPQLTFVISKGNTLIPDYNSDIITQIISKAFDIFKNIDLPRIILSDMSGTKSAGMALLTFLFEEHSRELLTHKIEIQNEIQKENEKNYAKKQALEAALKKEEKKSIMFKKPAVIEDLKNQISYVQSEIDNNSSQTNEKNKDITLRNIGTALNRLLVYNRSSAIKGFEKLSYPVDTELVEVVQKTSDKWMTIAMLIDILFLIFLIIMFFMECDEPLATIIASVFWGAVAIFVKNNVVRVIGLICVLVVIFQAIEFTGLLIALLYIGFVIFSFVGAEYMGKYELSKKPKIWRFRNDLTAYFDKKAKE